MVYMGMVHMDMVYMGMVHMDMVDMDMVHMDIVDMDMDMDMVDMDIVVPGNRSIGPFMLSDMPSVLGLVIIEIR